MTPPQPPWLHSPPGSRPAQGDWGAPPPWTSAYPRKRGSLLRGFVFLVLPFLLLLGAAFGVAAYLIFSPLRETLPPGEFWLLLVCALPLGFLFLAGLFGGWSFRLYGRPLAQLLAAVDAVAAGDFSVRVPEHGPRPLRRLAVSFNRMTAELARAENQRRNLTADVAHELRTPLHILQGNLEGLLDGVYPPSEEHLRATLDEAQRLARLVDDLQTLSLAESGKLPLYPQPVAALDLLDETAASFSAAASAAGVELLVTPAAPDAADLLVNVDAGRMAQVLANLVANALRHTPPGGHIRLNAAAVDNHQVRLEVADTGAGISPEDLPFVFERFWRGNKARTRQPGETGSGLGLAIARQFVEAHGGQIEVASPPGSGAQFTITLPASLPFSPGKQFDNSI